MGQVIGLHLAAGIPMYFTFFLFAYGFRDHIGWANHTAFLLQIVIFAVLVGLLSGGETERRPLAVVVSLALNAAAVGAGSIVSAMHKDEGSVSATFSTATDTAVAAGLLATSAVLVGFAVLLGERSGAGARNSGD